MKYVGFAGQVELRTKPLSHSISCLFKKKKSYVNIYYLAVKVSEIQVSLDLPPAEEKGGKEVTLVMKIRANTINQTNVSL